MIPIPVQQRLKRWLRFWGILSVIITTGSLVAQGAELQPMPVVSSKKIRLVEGTSFCYGGYGTQSTIFNIGSEHIRPESTPNPYAPSLRPYLTTFIKAGCFMDQIFAEFLVIEDAAKFEAAVFIDNEPYNSIKFQIHSLSVGYSFSIVPHFLYIDLGAGYSRTNFVLGLYNSNLGADAQGESTNNDAYFLSTAVNLYATHYLQLSWQHQRSFADDYVILYANQLGINFLARF